MKTRIVCIASCGVCVAVLGCASEQRRFTGFLRDYSALKPHPTIQGALVHWNQNIDPKKYKAVLLEPVDVPFMTPSEESRAKPEDVAALRRFITDELATAISKHAAIATKPGPNVLRCRLQVANLPSTQTIDEPPHPWPPREFVTGTADIETEARDSISGELVVAYVSPRGSVQVDWAPLWAGPRDRWEAAKEVLRKRIVSWTDHAARHFVTEF